MPGFKRRECQPSAAEGSRPREGRGAPGKKVGTEEWVKSCSGWEASENRRGVWESPHPTEVPMPLRGQEVRKSLGRYTQEQEEECTTAAKRGARL